MNKITSIIKFVAVAHLIVLASISSAFADYATAKKAYDEYRYDEAFAGFKESSEQGHMLAQHYLGVMYAMGHATPRDDVAAYKWFMKAALQGHPVSQGNIGTMKLNARGTEEDVTGSYFWFILAEDGGYEKAQKFMWRVTNYMSRDDINSIRAKAEEWIRENRGTDTDS